MARVTLQTFNLTAWNDKDESIGQWRVLAEDFDTALNRVELLARDLNNVECLPEKLIRRVSCGVFERQVFSLQ